MGGKTINLKSGARLGKLTVVRELPKMTLPSGQTNRVFLCNCDCGNQTRVRLLHLIRGRTKSCGCLSGDKSGDSGKGGLYNTWRAMKNRCSQNYFNSKIYNERGIDICEEWSRSYLSFKMWAIKNGYKKGLHIDRVDNNKGYYPDNCRFTTNLINSNNRADTYYVNYRGKKEAISLLLRRLGKIQHKQAIINRIGRGWDPEKAIDVPIRKGNYYKEKVYIGGDAKAHKNIF